jgi:mannose-6-phosphate isomerase
MSALYPMIFKPLLFEKIWGGDRLGTLLGKDVPPGAAVGESWEISDYPGKETVVANGPLAGTSLRTLVEERVDELVGDPAILQGGRFPLLVKYLDAKETLSVQVHPDDDYAAEHEDSFGKEETWTIIHVEPDAKLIRGVTPGTTRESFAQAIAEGLLEPRLHMFSPEPGDQIMIPWGMTHAIGAGIVLAEIQQTSDVTYRTYDWNRVDKTTGEPRELHIEKALAVTDYADPTRDTCEPVLLDDGPCKRYEAARCEKFVIERLELNGSMDDATPDKRFVILNVIEGDVVVAAVGPDGHDGHTPLPLGTTALIPASMGAYTIHGDNATVLRSYVP